MPRAKLSLVAPIPVDDLRQMMLGATAGLFCSAVFIGLIVVLVGW